MKFLVLWHFDVTRLTADVVRAIAEQPKYGEKLEADGKLECRYHVVGSPGGAWIYNVASNEELTQSQAKASNQIGSELLIQTRPHLEKASSATPASSKYRRFAFG